MQARASLMIEHRLIENMLHHLKDQLDRIEKTQSIDPYLVDKAIDFINQIAPLFRKMDNQLYSHELHLPFNIKNSAFDNSNI